MEARTASELLRAAAGGADAAFGATRNTLPLEDADVRARAMPAPPLGLGRCPRPRWAGLSLTAGAW